MKKIILLILALATPLMAQVSNPSIILVTNAPSGSCGGGLPMEYIFSTGVLYGCDNGTWATLATGGGGTGTVTSVSVTTANGVSGVVATATTTPAITLTLGAITPSSVNGATINTFGTANSNIGGALPATTTGINSTAVGANALSIQAASAGYNSAVGSGALQLDTTGDSNTAMGYNALHGDSTSSRNTAFGYLSLATLTTSNGANTGVGYAALNLNTSGTNNTAVGYFALSNLTSGTFDVGIGNQAGKFITGGSTANQTSLDSIYIGDGTLAKADGDTDETVIGEAATGNGSHTFTAGSATVTKFYPAGTIYVQGTAPTVNSNAGSGSLTHGTDDAGIIAVGAASTATTLTFHTGWATWAACTVSASTSTALPYVSTISASAATFTYVTTGTPTLYYTCFGQ